MIEPQNQARSALLVIDFQADFLQAQGKLPVAQQQVGGILEVANYLIKTTQELDFEVVYIGNEYSKWNIPINLIQHNAAIRGSSGAKLDQRLNVINNNYFAKARRDAFSNPVLHLFLQERQVDQLFLAGVFANACIRGTANGAIKRGYQVSVISDGVAAASEKGCQAALRAMYKEGVRVINSKEMLAQTQIASV